MGKKNNNNDKTFVRITNQDIYNSIQELKQDLTNLIINNKAEHKKIMGRVSLNKWIATTALSLVLFIIGWLLKEFLRIKY